MVIDYFERPYVVEIGTFRYDFDWGSSKAAKTGVDWEFHRAFNHEHDAAAYAQRISEDYELVRAREKKEFHDGDE